MVSKCFGIKAPVIISTEQYFLTFFIFGLSPAATVFKILNFFLFLLLKPTVSLEFSA